MVDSKKFDPVLYVFQGIDYTDFSQKLLLVVFYGKVYILTKYFIRRFLQMTMSRTILEFNSQKMHSSIYYRDCQNTFLVSTIYNLQLLVQSHVSNVDIRIGVHT